MVIRIKHGRAQIAVDESDTSELTQEERLRLIRWLLVTYVRQLGVSEVEIVLDPDGVE